MRSIVFFLMACQDPNPCPSGNEVPRETGDSSWVGETGDSNPDSAVDTAEPPLATVDVLVIGAGAGGLAAASAAKDGGASVLVLEREATAGGATLHAANFWAAGTSWQSASSIVDSPALALAEWEATTGGSASDPAVIEFVESSAAVLEWIASLGVTFTLSPNVSADTGSLPRTHSLDTTGAVPPPIILLASSLSDEIRYGTSATELVLEGNAVVGVRTQDESGTTGWIRATSVVIATGGFTRNDAMVLGAVPELASFTTWYESFPGMDGNGISMATAATAATQNLDHIGLYSHAVEDLKVGEPEVMVLVGLDSSLVVDAAGNRVTDERAFGSVSMGRRYLDEGPFYALFDDSGWASVNFQGRGFNYSTDIEAMQASGVEYEAAHFVASGNTGEEMASILGINPDGVATTIASYNADAAAGIDTQFGKPAQYLRPLSDPPFRGVPLVLGRAKSFGGLATDVDGRVTNAEGAIIPGLYAAGEACGFLGTPAMGYGLNGSVTAAWWSGLRAGRSTVE